MSDTKRLDKNERALLQVKVTFAILKVCKQQGIATDLGSDAVDLAAKAGELFKNKRVYRSGRKP